MEDKLDRIIKLLEELVSKDVYATKFNKTVKNVTDKIIRSKPSKEEFVKRVNEIDWSKITEPTNDTVEGKWNGVLKPKIVLLNEKGQDIGVKCSIQEDGSVICQPFFQEGLPTKEDTTILGWVLKRENNINDYKIFNSTVTELKKEVQYIKDRYDAPVEVLEELVKKVHNMLLDYEAAYEEQKSYNNKLKRVVPAAVNPSFGKDTTKTLDVFKQQVETNMFVYVGTMTDNVLTLNQSATVLGTHIIKPTTYFVDWFVKNTCPAIGCEWINVYPSNTVNDILVKENYMTSFVTTGYLTEDGIAVYYDQYL